MEDAEIDTGTTAEEIRFVAGFDRIDRLRLCNRRGLKERDITTLDGLSTEAIGCTCVHAGFVRQREISAELPASLTVADVDWVRDERRDTEIEPQLAKLQYLEVFFVVRISYASSQCQAVSYVIAALSKHGPGLVLLLNHRVLIADESN